MLDILVPVLGRPHRVEPLLESISAATTIPYEVLFLCSSGDTEEIAAVKAAGARKLLLSGPPANGQYAKKINLGYRKTKSEWLFLGADDLEFNRGWVDHALKVAGENIHVVATNDRANAFVRRGWLATHSLIRRSYIDEQGASLDGPGVIYHEGYSHNFVDCELSVLARSRRVFGFSSHAIVSHLHPLFKRSKMDSTYEVGLRDFAQDRQLFVERLSAFPKDELVRCFSAAARGVR